MNRISLKRNDARPQAWLGVVLSLASTAASLYNNYKSRQQQNQQYQDEIKRQNEEIKRQNKLLETNNQVQFLNNRYITQQNFKDDDENNLIYKCGGKLKLGKGGLTNLGYNSKIVRGGNAIQLNNNTFLLRGRSHTNGGIDINYGNKKIEAEGGEITDINPTLKQARIFSRKPMIPMYSNGGRFSLVSPASLILAGYPKNEVFAVQQAVNGNNGSPVKGNKNKAEWGDWVKLGIDTGGALINGYLTGKGLKKLQQNANYVTPEYYEESPVILNTRYNNSGQLASLNRQRLANRKSIMRNTASSQVANYRSQQNELDNLLSLNELMDYKANKEIELRNAQAQIDQGVRSRNIAAKNDWSNRVATIINAETDMKNSIRNMQIQNTNETIAGLGQAAENYFTTVEQRNADQNALRAYMAASNPGSYATFIANGGLNNKESYKLFKSILAKNYKTEDDALLARAAYGNLNQRQIRRLHSMYFNS